MAIDTSPLAISIARARLAKRPGLASTSPLPPLPASARPPPSPRRALPHP